MNDPTTQPKISENPKIIRQRRWPGVVLSVFVPGFGHFRAGAWFRGVLWMLGIYLSLAAFYFSFAFSFVPVIVGWVAFVFCLLLWIVMLRDNFHPGRMTWKLWILFAAFLSVNFILPDPRDWLCKPFRIHSGAMEPTFINGDRIVVDLLSHRFNGFKRGDIVVFSGAGIPVFEDEIFYVKRLVGFPGEQIEIKNNAVYIDGKRLTEADGIPPITYYPASPHLKTNALKEGEVFIVGPDEYFVLGDNSMHSLDCRYWGGVPITNLAGKVSKIYYPFSRTRNLKNTRCQHGATLKNFSQ